MMMMSLSRTTNALRPFVHRHAARNMTILSKQSGEEYKKENYTARMKLTGRPVSPHLTVYAFPITALTSITNRATGMALSFGCAGLGACEIMGGSGTSLAIMESLGNSNFLVAGIAKFAVAFPLTYHYLGGVRHMMWDKYPDMMLNNEDATKSSYMLAGSSVAISTIMMFL